MHRDCFGALGLARDADEAAVRRAYSALIKQFRPDSHPAEFARIRHAYEQAMRACRARQETGDGASWPEVQAAHRHLPEIEEPENAPGEQAQPVARRIVMDVPVTALAEDRVLQKISALERAAEHADEAHVLALYRDQAQAIAGLPLDLQMDYARSLREWVIYSGHAPLRLIREAAAHYGWSDQLLEVARTEGRDAARRLEGLIELAAQYDTLRRAPSVYLRAGGEYGRAPVFALHHVTFEAQERAARWAAACEQAGVPDLAQRVQFALPSRMQIFWLDIILMSLSAALGWLVVGPQPDWDDVFVVLSLSSGMLLLPMLGRTAALALKARGQQWLIPETGVRRWLQRKLGEKGDVAWTLLDLTLFLAAVESAIFLRSPWIYLVPPLWLYGMVYVYGSLVTVERIATVRAMQLVRLPQSFRAWRAGRRAGRRRAPVKAHMSLGDRLRAGDPPPWFLFLAGMIGILIKVIVELAGGK